MQKLELKIPLVVAPMGGGPTTPELVASSSNAGALGSLAAAYLSPEQIEKEVLKTRSFTDRPFAINLFTPMPLLNLNSANRIFKSARG